MRINYTEAAQFLKQCGSVYILTHESPDGDTLGSAFGLCRILRNMGRKANVLCSDDFPPRMSFMYDWYSDEDFEPDAVIAVDVADKRLLGSGLEKYSDMIVLCIDHHISNTEYADRLLLGEGSAAACEVIFRLAEEMGESLDAEAATCLYTGIATDTGCFKYENVTSETHRIAAELYKFDIPFARINRKLFDIKSVSRIKAEQAVFSEMELCCGGRCAVSAVTLELMERTGLDKDDFDGMASLPMQLEGVEIAVTLKEKSEGIYKISVRTAEYADASAFCQRFGGGGHKRAAGCVAQGTLEDVKQLMKQAAAEALADGA